MLSTPLTVQYATVADMVGNGKMGRMVRHESVVVSSSGHMARVSVFLLHYLSVRA